MSGGLAGLGAGIALKLSGVGGVLKGVGGFLGKIPWQVYAVIGGLVALWGVWHWHGVKVRAADRAGYSRRAVEDLAAITKLRDHALALKINVESLGANIAGTLKEEHNAQIARVGADVDDIMRNGTGKAGCGRLDHPFTVAGSGGQGPVPGSGASAVAEVPDRGGAELIAMPFPDAARLFGQCDINRDEAAKWRLNDDKQRAIWNDYRKALAAPPK